MDPVTGLSLGRLAVGIGSIVAPEKSAAAFGIDPARNPQVGLFTRLFGVREVAIGATTLLARGEVRNRLVAMGLAVDGGDAVTGALALTRREVPPVTGALLVAVATGAVVTAGRALASSDA